MEEWGEALKESIELFFGDFDFSLAFLPTKKYADGGICDIMISMDILDEKDNINHAIYMGLSHDSALTLTKILNENEEPDEEEIKSTIMEMLNIFGGHALQDLPPLEDENSYYFLAPPFYQTRYVVDPMDFLLLSNQTVEITHNASKELSSLHFCLFRKIE